MDDAESAWLNALGMDYSDDEDDEAYENVDEDAMLMVCDDDELDGRDDDLRDREEDSEASEDDVEFSETMKDYVDDPKELFTLTELVDLKKKEKTLIERRQNGYYRNKHKHKKAYEQIVEVYAPYITRENLLMLHHPWSTQKNEAMNKSVSSYAPKDRTFSTTKSLLTRVTIAGAVQGTNNLKVWRNVFRKIRLPLDPLLEQFFTNMDKHKAAKNKRQSTKEGKLRRSKRKRDALTTAHKDDMQSQKEGTKYESGIAMREMIRKAKTSMANNKRNPQGTPKDKQRCIYFHPEYCTTLGHATCSSPMCFMKTKTVQQRKAAYNQILKEKAAQAELENTDERK